MSEAPPVVLHVLEALSSGTSRHVIDLVRYAGGVEHHVAAPLRRSVGGTDGTALATMEAAGAELHIVDIRRFPLHPVNALALMRLTRLTRDLGADIVHGHSSIGGVLARLIPCRAGRVYTPNGYAQGSGALIVERLLARRTDRLVAVSHSEAEFALERQLIDSARVTVIPNGVDLDPVAPSGALRAALGLDSAVPLVGMVGRLARQKAPLDFVAACRLVAQTRQDVQFVMVGDGELAGAVDAEALPLGLRFTRLAHVEHVAAAMHDLDVLMLLSRYEGGPYVPLEAARAGVPLVLTDVIGSRDVVVPGESGRLVPAGDPRAAADATLDLLGDRDESRRLAASMRGRLARSFDVRQQGLRHVELYKALTARQDG